MPAADPWHDQDAFWALFEPVLFNPHRKAQAQVEIEQIRRLLGLAPPARILDLCCGVGRHSLALAAQGYAVVGVDRTVPYIDKARTEAKRQSLDVTFEVADMRSYCAPGSFDIVLNLFGSFGYFADPADDLSGCGFTDVQVYGSLSGIDYDQNAQRLVIAGRK